MSDPTDFLKLFDRFWDEDLAPDQFHWSLVPERVQVMCVMRMDFTTRMRLRQTAKREKQLVEVNIPQCEVLIMQYYWLPGNYRGTMEVTACVGNKFESIYKYENFWLPNKLETLLSFLFDHAGIDHVVLDGFEKDGDERTLAGILDVMPRPFSKLSLKNLHGECLQVAIEGLGAQIQTLNIWKADDLDGVLEDSLLLSILLNMKTLQIHIAETSQIPIETLTDLWIENDIEMGSKLIIDFGGVGTRTHGIYNAKKMEGVMFEQIQARFQDRICVSNQDENMIRIRTNDPERFIIMRLFKEPHDDKWFKYLVFQVVPIDWTPPPNETSSGVLHVPVLQPKSSFFNWRGLPVELQTLCVKEMNFATRMKLRRTAWLEKDIIEANKPTFNRMIVCESKDDPKVAVTTTGGHDVALLKGADAVRTESLITSLLKYANFDGLQLEFFGKGALGDGIIDRMAESGHGFKQLWVRDSPDRCVLRILRKLSSGVNHFDLIWPTEKVIERALRNSVVAATLLQASVLQIHLNDPIPFHKIIQLWLDNDQKVGCKLVIIWKYPKKRGGEFVSIQMKVSIFTEFLQIFGSRVIANARNEVRIRMDGSDKHIIMAACAYSIEMENGEREMRAVVWDIVPATSASAANDMSSFFPCWRAYET